MAQPLSFYGEHFINSVKKRYPTSLMRLFELLKVLQLEFFAVKLVPPNSLCRFGIHMIVMQL